MGIFSRKQSDEVDEEPQAQSEVGKSQNQIAEEVTQRQSRKYGQHNYILSNNLHAELLMLKAKIGVPLWAVVELVLTARLRQIKRDLEDPRFAELVKRFCLGEAIRRKSDVSARTRS